jgi:hypothetical protein
LAKRVERGSELLSLIVIHQKPLKKFFICSNAHNCGRPKREQATIFSLGGSDMTKTAEQGGRAGYRPSTYINRKVTQSIFDAFEFAVTVSRPLNTYVVINMREEARASSATIFCLIRHKYRDWLTHRRRTGGQSCVPTYIYAFENTKDQPHVNWVLHVPPSLEREFARKLEAWVRKAQSLVGPFDIKIEPVQRDYAKRLAKYVLKGTHEDFIEHFHLQNVYEGSQGTVWGKRAGCSPSLSKMAREKAGFKRPRRRFPDWPAGPIARAPAMRESIDRAVQTTPLRPVAPFGGNV